MSSGRIAGDNSDILLASFDDLAVTLSHKAVREVPEALDHADKLYSVESYGVVLLPLTPVRREAIAVYEHSQSREKTLLMQQGFIRSVLFTNAGQIREKEKS